MRRLLNPINTADIKDAVVEDGKVTLRKFNPMIEYQMIGNSRLNHIELLDKEFDWESLLAQISTMKIKTLVWNRFEMQEDSGGFLTEEEKELAGKVTECLKFHWMWLFEEHIMLYVVVHLTNFFFSIKLKFSIWKIKMARNMFVYLKEWLRKNFFGVFYFFSWLILRHKQIRRILGLISFIINLLDLFL